MIPLHLGELHSVEGLLVGVLAFGPFLVVAAVVVVLRRRGAAEDSAGSAAEPEADGREPREEPGSTGRRRARPGRPAARRRAPR